MVTIYDLLEVDEKATIEEIEKSYQRLIMEYHKDPKLSEEENSDNELILNKLKMSYDILSNPEKRKKYDAQLAQKRAEELIKGVSVVQKETIVAEEQQEEPKPVNEIQINNKTNVYQEKYQEEYQEEYDEENREDIVEANLTNEEKAKLRKAAQKEFKENLKKAQKAEEEYNKAYNQAYNDYLRKMGYQVKEPWTLKRVKNLIITVVAIIIVCALIWIIPPTRNLLINLYEENIIVKSLVDIVIMIWNAIIQTFK